MQYSSPAKRVFRPHSAGSGMFPPEIAEGGAAGAAPGAAAGVAGELETDAESGAVAAPAASAGMAAGLLGAIAGGLPPLPKAIAVEAGVGPVGIAIMSAGVSVVVAV